MAESDLIQTVDRVLREAFPGCETDLNAAGAPDRAAGWVIWEGFVSLDQIERQKRLKLALADLPREQKLQLGPILTMTPAEITDDEDAA